MKTFNYILYILALALFIAFVYAYIAFFKDLNVYAIIMIPIAVIGGSIGVIKFLIKDLKRDRKNK